MPIVPKAYLYISVANLCQIENIRAITTTPRPRLHTCRDYICVRRNPIQDMGRER